MIIAAITEVAAERDIDSAVEKGNRGALILVVDLGNGSCTTDCVIQRPGTFPNLFGPPTIPNVAVRFNESMVRAGINYKFGS